MRKYLFFDLDGTLLGRSRQLHPDTLDALRRLHDKGEKLFICSGRSPAFLETILPQVPFDGFVGCAGGCVVVEGKTIFENNIPSDLLQKILHLFEENNVVYNFENREATWQSAGSREFHKKRNLERIRNDPAFAAAIAKEQKSSTWRPMEDFPWESSNIPKLSFSAMEPAKFETLCPFLEQYFHVVYFMQSPEFIAGELIDRNCTKADGVRRAAAYYGGTIADTIGYGDSMNDYQMIEAVQIGVVSEQSPEQLKQIAKYFFADPDKGGIAVSLKELGLL